MRALNFFLIWIILFGFGILFPCTVVPAAETQPYDPRGRRDPFIPLVTGNAPDASGLFSVESLDDAVIEGVVYDPKSTSVVILNGTLIKEGETVGNVTVVKVRPDGAVLSVSGSEAFIPMQANSSGSAEIS